MILKENIVLFFLSAPVAFRRVALETPEWTSRDSNHHRQSVSAGKTNAIPTEPSGRLEKKENIVLMLRAQQPPPNPLQCTVRGRSGMGESSCQTFPTEKTHSAHFCGRSIETCEVLAAAV